MDRVELCSVTNAFEIHGRGLVLVPDFSVPDGWKDREEVVVLEHPEGNRIESRAIFNLTHFNISDPTIPLDRRWRVVLLLPDLKKRDAPAGTKIFVSAEIRNVLIGRNPS
ncbi:MAG TPA: hypothetical protein VHD36_10910 [Pirellulales bacterium]|nr:hypothetical protein [Pirellulales bacterium]